MKKRISSIVLAFCMVLTLLPTTALAADGFANETTANGQYHLSYRTGDDMLKPEVSGTDNAPVLTFRCDNSHASGGVITSNYTMDFTRSFNIEGSVSAVPRDGVSFALHTTKNKEALYAGWNTHMMGGSLLDNGYGTGWKQSDTSWTVTTDQNNITNGLLWDFIGCGREGSRAYKGAYSYQIESQTFVKAFPDDTSGNLGIKSYTSATVNGAFKLSWQCTNPTSATGKLTLQMGNDITFTYSNLNASDIFGGLSNAKAVYFSFSTAMPTQDPATNKIAIDKAYYTDTDDGSGKSTLGVETSYWIDTDNSGTYETQLKKATLVGADQTVLCRNKIYNRNKNATAEMDMTVLIPNLSSTTSGSDSKIGSISGEKFYTHAHETKEETQDDSKMLSQGSGPLNSTAPLTDYVKVTLPSGGDGTSAYEDAYAVYEYTFTPGANATALNQTIQLGVAPFTPAVLSSTVFFNSPEAFKPDTAAGKILFGADGAGGNGLYRVVAKDSTSVTLFYDGEDISSSGMAHDVAATWLTGDFWNTLTAQEQAAVLPYGVESITDKVVIPSENEAKDSGTWSLDNDARATAENAEDSTDWWLRTAGSTGDTHRAVTQNGTQIVDIATSQTNGVRPVMRLNLANVLFTKDKTVNLTNSPSESLTALNAVGSEQAPFRLTLLDTSRNFAVLEDNNNIDVSAGDRITFNYTGATAGESCYISALLTDSKGQDIYYGRLKAVEADSDANGTASAIVPNSGLSNGTYILKLFSETIYADKASDVGSSLQSLTLVLGNNLNGAVNVSGTAEYGCTLTATVTNSNYLGTLQYQWKRSGADISGATDNSYTLTADDIGKEITCEVVDSGEGKRDSSISSTAETIDKRSLLAKADDKQITTGQALPTFSVSCSGFVNSDNEESVFVAVPTAAVEEAVDGKTAGSFPISLTAELKAEFAALYALTAENGTLTVSNPSSGGSSGLTVTVPVSSDAGSANVSATVSGATASVTVTDSQLKAVIDSAKQTGTVTVDVSGLKNVSTAKIPAKVVSETADSDTATGLKVSLPTGSVTLDGAAVESLKGEGDITISVENVKTSSLTETQKNVLGDKLDSAVVVDVNVLMGGIKVSDFGGGRLTVSFPYTTKAGEETERLTIWYINAKGAIENVGGHYDAAKGCFVFTTTHLSQYVLVYDEAVTNPFIDVLEGSYYYDAVLWAASKGITTGVTENTYAPDGICTRAQTVTFLWRAMGSPAPKASNCQFTDVRTDAYYYKAVLWAAEKGITLGTSDTSFSPDETVTRAQTVTFLWRAAEKPTQSAENPFGDVEVGAYYENAVLWAVARKITEGTAAGEFSPTDGCTRAQIVTFLWRYMGK